MKYLFLFLIFAPVLMPVIWVRAQTDELKAAKEDLKDSYEKLAEIKESEELTQQERDKRELEAKILTLQEVVKFTIAETKSLISRLSAIRNLPPEYGRLQNNYLKTLKEFLKYQEQFLADLTVAVEGGSLNLEAVQELALDFKEWRETVYDPEIKKIVSFLLAFRSSDLLEVAIGRLTKIASDLKFFYNSKVIKAELLIPALQEAGAYLQEATLANQAAIQSLLATTTDPAETNDLVGKVFELIKSAYGKFLEMSALVKKMLSV